MKTLNIPYQQSNMWGLLSSLLLSLWPIILALVVMYLPVFVTLATEVWPQSSYAHGPVVFAIILYLAYKALDPKVKPVKVSLFDYWLGSCVFLFGMLCYVIGQSQSLTFLVVGSQILVVSGLILLLAGRATLHRFSIPILLIFFLIPLPAVVIDTITGPLKEQVSIVVDNLLYSVGYPIARSGVVLTVGNYQMLIADACSGLNSMYALAALGVVYVHLRKQTSMAHKLILLALILPIAFLVNILRVTVLVLITYHYGDIAGQRYHDIAAASEFLIALLCMLGVDKLISLFPSANKPKDQSSGWI